MTGRSLLATPLGLAGLHNLLNSSHRSDDQEFPRAFHHCSRHNLERVGPTRAVRSGPSPWVALAKPNPLRQRGRNAIAVVREIGASNAPTSCRKHRHTLSLCRVRTISNFHQVALSTTRNWSSWTPHMSNKSQADL